MYKVNDLIIYGKTGVCKIVDITVPKNDDNDSEQLYYVLQPADDNCTIYTPVNTKVPIRSVISEDEAKRLIEMIPEIDAEAYYNDRMQELTNHYKEVLEAQSCENLIELLKSIYAKKRIAEQQNKKFGQIDGKFMKQAEDLLYSEFSFALGIPKDDVPDYIAAKVNALIEDKEEGTDDVNA